MSVCWLVGLLDGRSAITSWKRRGVTTSHAPIRALVSFITELADKQNQGHSFARWKVVVAKWTKKYHCYPQHIHWTFHSSVIYEKTTLPPYNALYKNTKGLFNQRNGTRFNNDCTIMMKIIRNRIKVLLWWPLFQKYDELWKIK